MKKIFLVLFLMFFSTAFAKNLKGSIESYSDFFQYIKLTEEQEEKISKIRQQEETVLKPYVLDVCAKEDSILILKNLKCSLLDKKCKRKLKQDIQLRKDEQQEALRKIDLKKRYFEIRYRNILTREQDLEYQRIKNLTEQQEKALSDTQKRLKRQKRIDRMKLWRKFNSKSNKKQNKPIKGVETGF